MQNTESNLFLLMTKLREASLLYYLCITLYILQWFSTFYESRNLLIIKAHLEAPKRSKKYHLAHFQGTK